MASDATPINDVAKIFAEAEKEVAEAAAKEAKGKIIAKLAQIKGAKKVLANLELELEMIKRDLQAGV
jgi:hypothetical protein